MSARGFWMRTKLVGVAVIAIVLIAVLGIYFSSRPLAVSVSVATSTSVGTVGVAVTFTALPSPAFATVSSVLWNYGDGSNETTTGPSTTHIYDNGGYYLVLAMVSLSYQNVIFSNTATVTNAMSLFPIIIQPSLTQAQAQNASVPTINFPLTLNPNAPIFSSGNTIQPVGGFLEAPTNTNWSIIQYVWNFGNGNTQTIAASSSGDPSQNVRTSYSSPGLYPLSLTLITNRSSGAKFSVTTVHTIAVQSSSKPFAILKSAANVVNPGVITSAEVAPGGPYSFDPQLDYDVVGEEELFNIFQTLVYYNGSSTTSFIPYLASEIPTQQNGAISHDFTTYTFHIRDDQHFSNDDPLTAFDVWFSFARGIALAAGSPGTPDWIQDQYLIPGVQNGTANVYTNNTWVAATTAITYDNASNTVTLHFNRSMAPSLAFQILADPEGAAVIDAQYAWSVGAGFNEMNWASYMSQANSGSYNTKMQWNPIGSGPYMIQSFTPGQSVELVPNPQYGGVPGIPKVTTTVVIDWVKTPDTALLMLQDGQADSIGGVSLPSSDFPSVQVLQSQGIVGIYNFPTITIDFYSFNVDINKSIEAIQFGPGYNEPPNYFADLPTRFAFVDAFDYSGYINNILGNAKYGTTFGTPYVGLPPPGVVYSLPSNELGGVPQQNLKAAKGNFSISAFHDEKVNLPIVVRQGQPADFAAALEWSSTLNQVSGGNITATPIQVTVSQLYAYVAAGVNPMGLYLFGWAPDYPDPSDTFDGMFLPGGYYPAANDFATTSFASLPPNTPYDVVRLNGKTYSQDVVYSWLVGNVTEGDTSVDPSVKQSAYKTADMLAIAMGLYVYTQEEEYFWYWRTWLHGYQSQENPMVGAFGDLAYFWISKG